MASGCGLLRRAGGGGGEWGGSRSMAAEYRGLVLGDESRELRMLMESVNSGSYDLLIFMTRIIWFDA